MLIVGNNTHSYE